MRFLQRVRCWEYRQLPSIVRVTHPTRPDPIRLVVSATSPNRVMWSIVSASNVVGVRGLFPRVLCTVNLQTRELLSWSFSEARGLLLRSVLVESWVVWGLLTHTGSMRTQLTSTLRLYWLILHIPQSEMIQGSTGSVILSTSTESSEVLPLQAKNTEDYVERGTETTRIGLPAGPPGRGTTLSPSVKYVKIAWVCSVLSCFIFLVRVDFYEFDILGCWDSWSIIYI